MPLLAKKFTLTVQSLRGLYNLYAVQFLLRQYFLHIRDYAYAPIGWRH